MSYDEEPPDSDGYGTPPPQDVDAERAVLGSVMIAKSALEDVLDMLTGPEFYRPNHETIWHAIATLSHRDEPVDAITVADELTRTGDLKRAGGHAYLHELIAAVPTAASASYYADIVLDRAVRRRLVDAGSQIARLGHTSPEAGNLPEVLAASHDTLAAVTDAHQPDAPIPHAQAVFDAIDSLDSPTGMPTPWSPLTRCLAGWKPGALYICGARPSVGKSVIALGAILDAARRGQHAVLFSLEMTRDETMHRLMSAVGSVPMDHLQHRTLTPQDHASLGEAAHHLAALPMTIDDRTNLSLAQMRTTIRRIQRDQPVGLVVVDYLQLIAPPAGAPRNDRRVQVDAISRGLKAFAKDIGAPVLALTQLNRATEETRDKVPTLANLREAGGQEQDADVVFLLHRDTREEPQTLGVVVAKNRHGPLTRFDLDFVGQFARAETRSWLPASALGKAPA